MKKSTATMLAAAGLIVAGAGYLAYFDYKRRNDPKFRRKLKKDYKKAKKLAQSTSSNSEATVAERALFLVEALQSEPLPTDPAEKETFFMAKVSAGEALAMKGPSEFENAAKNFYQALKIYPNPIELIMIYQKTVPQPIFELIMSMMTQEVNLKKKRYFNTFPPKSMNVKALPISTEEPASDKSSSSKPKSKKASKSDKKSDASETKEDVDPQRVLYASKSFKKGDLIYTETPLVSCLLLECENGEYCHDCLRKIPEKSENPLAISEPLSNSSIPTIPELQTEDLNDLAESTSNDPSATDSLPTESVDFSKTDSGSAEAEAVEQLDSPSPKESVISSSDAIESEVIVEHLNDSVKLEDFEYNSIHSSDKESQSEHEIEADTSSDPASTVETDAAVEEAVVEVVAAAEDDVAEIVAAAEEEVAEVVATAEEKVAEIVVAAAAEEAVAEVVAAAEETVAEEAVAEVVDAATVEETVAESEPEIKSYAEAVQTDLLDVEPKEADDAAESSTSTSLGTELMSADTSAILQTAPEAETLESNSKLLSPSFCSETCNAESRVIEQKYLAAEKSLSDSTKLMKHIEETGSILPILITRLFGSIVEIEKRKEMATTLRIPVPHSKVSYLNEEKGAEDYSIWEHLERLASEKSEVTESDTKATELIDKILGVNIEGLTNFVNEDRYQMLKNKFINNNYFIGAKEEEEGSVDSEEVTANSTAINSVDKFRLVKNQNKSVGTGLFLVSSYIQKSSSPNVELRFVDGTDKATLVAISDINEGDALFADY
ncbi:Mitochondrial import receptor subunit tom20 [Smittium culicis]|uniref:Mitochondrial import receptor subunit tom20 n=1 Tax=Smittium culicis TaxID=133412 RepID=A0A1R1Y0U0_9FUNG|nr:Mitochondrial import receptor subunit tom20 [Smittium culicis]